MPRILLLGPARDAAGRRHDELPGRSVGEVLDEAVARWLTGDAPFVAKLHPELAPYGDYDQLMRLDEWYGRQERAPEESGA